MLSVLSDTKYIEFKKTFNPLLLTSNRIIKHLHTVLKKETVKRIILYHVQTKKLTFRNYLSSVEV